jgi:hypothetical protein
MTMRSFVGVMHIASVVAIAACGSSNKPSVPAPVKRHPWARQLSNPGWLRAATRNGRAKLNRTQRVLHLRTASTASVRLRPSPTMPMARRCDLTARPQ